MIATLTESHVVNSSKVVKSDCVAIEFINDSASNTVLINGIELTAGATLSITNDYPYFDQTQYQVLFQAGAGTNKLTVVKTVLKNKPDLIGLE